MFTDDELTLRFKLGEKRPNLDLALRDTLAKIRDYQMRDPEYDPTDRLSNPAIAFRLLDDGLFALSVEQEGEELWRVETEDLAVGVLTIFLGQQLREDLTKEMTRVILYGPGKNTGFTGVIIEGTEDLPS